MRIQPNHESELMDLPDIPRYRNDLRKRMEEAGSVVRLSPKLSLHLVEKLSAIDDNIAALRLAAEAWNSPSQFRGVLSQQADAVRTALQVFGISPDDAASSLDIVGDQSTALTWVRIREDTVIQHDAGTVPGYQFECSDLTGRALFKAGTEALEIYTANRLPLEEAFGVDLVYLNLTKKNIVMVQYKMLEKDDTDWAYREDKKLVEQIKRMKLFAKKNAPGPGEYRMCPDVFYLKFVRRDARIGKNGIVLPVAHYNLVKVNPAFLGPKGGVRVSYATLAGQYLWQTPFVNLIKAGYIGAYADTTFALETLVKAILKDDRSVVAAIQSKQLSV